MPRFSANISMMFCERPFLDRFAAAADAGFPAVEIQFPYDTPVEDIVKTRDAAGIEVALINLPVGDMLSGGPGLAAMPGREVLFREAVEEALNYAAALNPRNVNVLPGIPPAAELGREACLNTLAGNLHHAAEQFASIGVGVVTEAVNAQDRPGFFLSTSAQALEAIDRADHPGLAIQHDLYHMQIMEGRLTERLREVIHRVGHIQFADVPGRNEPGTGEIDFTAAFETIDQLGYDGWVGAEYVPSTRTEDSLDWMRSWR